MSSEATSAPPPPASFQQRLRSYARSLSRQDELAELVLQLSAHQNGGGGQVPDDPGLRALGEATGLDWSNEGEVSTAIVALGERSQWLRARRQREIAEVGARDLSGLGVAMLGQLEAVRIAEIDASVDTFRESAELALASYRRNAPPRSDEDRRWRARVEEAVLDRFVPAYTRAALHLNRIEDGLLSGRLLRNPALAGLLCASLGIVTIPMMVSTPLVCIVLALFGAFVLHPAWVRMLASPLRAALENLQDEGALIDSLSAETPWSADSLRLRPVVEALLPRLESARAAGRVGEDELRAVITATLDEIAPHLDESGASAESFERVRRYCQSRLARDYARYAAARARWEGSLLVRVVDRPELAAVFFGAATLPVAALSSMVSPLPPAVDFPLMVAIFIGVGWFLPRLLPGTLPAREALLGEMELHQRELEKLD